MPKIVVAIRLFTFSVASPPRDASGGPSYPTVDDRFGGAEDSLSPPMYAVEPTQLGQYAACYGCDAEHRRVND